MKFDISNFPLKKYFRILLRREFYSIVWLCFLSKSNLSVITFRMSFTSIAITIHDDESSTAIKWSNHILHKKNKSYMLMTVIHLLQPHTWEKSKPKINIAECAERRKLRFCSNIQTISKYDHPKVLFKHMYVTLNIYPLILLCCLKTYSFLYVVDLFWFGLQYNKKSISIVKVLKTSIALKVFLKYFILNFKYTW